MTFILGLNAYHADSSACLFRDGELIAAVCEERLGQRIKHFVGFPAEAIKAVLAIGGVGIGDVGHVAIGHNHRANSRQKMGYVARHPIRAARAVASHFARRKKVDSLQEQISRECGFPLADCKFEVHEVEHHLAHLASSFYASGMKEAAGFSYDASGDFVSGMFARCEGNRIDVLDRVFMPHSLGIFYTAVCQFIGFDHFGEEYKVMGLAAYGQPRFLSEMRKLLMPGARGQYALGTEYFTHMSAPAMEDCLDERGQIVLPPLYSDKLKELLGTPRARAAELTQRDKDLAASCQRHFEEVVLHSLRWLRSEVPSDNLITAGGCALNGVCNARILRETPFKKQYIQCAASDDGTAIGAALHVWNAVLGGARIPAIEKAYWGPAHDANEIERALAETGLKYRKLDEPALLEEIASRLAKGEVVGWYQGRSEWGPRALGNRSILAHPGWPGMKDTINRKIKRREAFRPFAPSILADAVDTYFEQHVESPFMMHVVTIRPEQRTALAAVCHEDFTGRLHTVTRAQNQLYYDLISAFAKKTGVPVVLNTSFNENEPIVDTPMQAISCFLRNDIDVVCVGNYVAVKSEQAKT